MSRVVAGIDEAGRGAVIGPLVVAGVSFLDSDTINKELARLGVRDSKTLSRTRREELAGVVRSLKQQYITRRITPAACDRTSLNALEARATARICNTLSPHTAFVDVPAHGVGVERYCDEIRSHCKGDPDIVGGNRFDHIHSVVAAASIIAKEAREVAVRALHKEYGDFGSGYPSDPKTRQWLVEWRDKHNSWPPIVRTTWATLERI